MMNEPQRRLLDLLFGWSEFLSRWKARTTMTPEQARVLDLEIEAIADLYQRVGQVEQLSLNDFNEFMAEIRALLLRGSP